MGRTSFVSQSKRDKQASGKGGSFGRDPSRALEQIAVVTTLSKAKGSTKKWQKAFGMSVGIGLAGCALMFGVGKLEDG